MFATNCYRLHSGVDGARDNYTDRHLAEVGRIGRVRRPCPVVEAHLAVHPVAKNRYQRVLVAVPFATDPYRRSYHLASPSSVHAAIRPCPWHTLRPSVLGSADARTGATPNASTPTAITLRGNEPAGHIRATEERAEQRGTATVPRCLSLFLRARPGACEISRQYG